MSHSRRRTIRGHALHDAVAREQPRERLVLVLARASRKVGVVARDLLQAQHVEIGRLARDPGDARRVDPPVASAAPLDIPGDELHTYQRRERPASAGLSLEAMKRRATSP